ncbi:MAG: hypothetical protein K1X89_22530 [Myxococcaceae bacterium]|nr:hypothetical protein [Myxococcaceae bacterium]
MGFIKGLIHGAASLMNKVATVASFVPGIGTVASAVISTATAALNVVDGLTHPPVQWGKILGTAAMSMVPLGFGKALKSFSAAFPKGGTAMNFAEHLSGRMAENLRDVSGKVMKMNPELGGTFARLSENMATKFSSPEYMEKFAGIVSKATGTEPGAILSAEQISHAGENIISQVQNLTGTYAVTLGKKGDLDASRFEEKPKAPVAL